MRVTLREAEKFHGHMGPYLVLGILAGEAALKKLNCKKYFGVSVSVRGASNKPKSCLIDGLQLSTGATFGKGNIKKRGGSVIEITVSNCANQKKAVLSLKDSIVGKLKKTKSHKDAEILAKQLYNTGYRKVFHLKN
jgi:formylmethanofuran dehydrogenase subunit E